MQERPLSSAQESATPVTWREVLAVALVVALCDVTIYRGHGLAGYAALFAVAPVLLFAGSPHRVAGRSTWLMFAMLLVLAARMLWCGAAWHVAVGFGLLVAFTACLAGRVPYVLVVFEQAAHSIRSGFDGLYDYLQTSRESSPKLPGLTLFMPLAAVFVFGGVFTLANPDVVAFVSEHLAELVRRVRQWLELFSPWEIGFLLAVLWITVGLLRPAGGYWPSAENRGWQPTMSQQPAPLYAACRNTLLAVIGLFAVYLVFEFRTLWFRDFPTGFHYSGYAHEGAAWLTVALALATVILSTMFRGTILHDPRLPQLRHLAWMWSGLNFLLAVAVYNRLLIYVNFNGMTRMRTIAFFGVTTVVVGFIWVVARIHYNRTGIWLIQRQLWTLAVAIYLYALMPVDALVTRYNVGRILNGDPAPSVEISVHPIQTEGFLQLEPLLESDNEIIRNGVRAMFAVREREMEQRSLENRRKGWTTIQFVDRPARARLHELNEHWREYAEDDDRRDAALERFHEYAYQWY